MEGNYIVRFGSDQVGKVQVIRQGLYYVFHCRCRLTGAVMCRLEVTCGEAKENLGVLVPMDGGFGLDTRIPAKRLKGDEPQFMVIPRHDRVAGTFVPIYPEEPFTYIEHLKDGYLLKKDGQIGMML